MEIKTEIRKNIILVAYLVADKIDHYVLVDGVPVYASTAKSVGGMSVEEYRNSPTRGLFHYVTHAQVIKSALKLIEKIKQIDS